MRQSLQSTPPDKREGLGDAGTFSDLVPTRNCQPALQSQVLALPLIHFPTFSSPVPLHLWTTRPAPPHIWRTFLGPLGQGLLPSADAPTRPAVAQPADPPGTQAFSPWEDGVQSALGPGSWLQRSEPTEVYLFIIYLG